jgi:signal transduction histidine kinase/ActR/RegA family two-component response regulator
LPTADTSPHEPTPLDTAQAEVARLRQEVERLRSASLERSLRYRSFIEQTSDAVWCFEYGEPIPITLPIEQQIGMMTNATLVECNDVCAHIYGRKDAQDAVGIRFEDLVTLEEESFLEGLRDYARNGYKARETINVVPLPDGGKRYLRNNAQGIVEDGFLMRIWGTFADVTKEHVLAEQLRKSQKTEALGTLASGVAHDLNNVLSVVIGNTEMLQDVITDQQSIGDVEGILAAAFHGRDVIQRIVAFTRKAESNPSPLAVSRCLDDTLRLLRATVPAHISISTSVSDPALRVLADGTQVQQILVNLGTNSVHAMKEAGGTLAFSANGVTVGASDAQADLKPGEYVVITVADTGSGMDEETQRRAFEPFYTTKPVGEGTGMGLAVVQGIIASHGGAVHIESALGEGTRISIYLPRTNEPVAEAPATTSRSSPGTERVLVVDDMPALTRLLSRLLMKAGYETVVAHNGQDALAVLESDPTRFDAMITDHNMPGMMGTELAGEALRIHPDLAVLLCTGFIGRVDERRALDQGVSAFLQKPVETAELLRTLRKCINSRRENRAP